MQKTLVLIALLFGCASAWYATETDPVSNYTAKDVAMAQAYSSQSCPDGLSLTAIYANGTIECADKSMTFVDDEVNAHIVFGKIFMELIVLIMIMLAVGIGISCCNAIRWG